MKPRHKRIAIAVGVVAAVGVAVGLVLNAFQSNLVFFYSPSQIASNEAPANRTFRLGGMVEEGSLKRETGSMEVRFVVTDFHNDVTVSYSGVLPDLFREGQGVIARGQLGAGGVFVAQEVLAKHDENYMPPAVAESLRKQHEKKTPAPGPST
jgi:cytochrome c-type biogenesis protein CcmE